MWVPIFTTISEQRRLSCIMLDKDNILVWSTQHFIFPLLRTREGYIPTYLPAIKIDCCRGNPFQACLSEIAIDRDRPRFYHNQLGLFICCIGHNCPVPSSQPHTPMSGAHWPNGMEQFTPFHWRQICDGCSTNSQSFQGLFTFFFIMITQSFMWWRLRNIHII